MRRVGEVWLDLAEHLRLDLRVLEHGLDHQVRAGSVRRIGGRDDLRQQGLALLLARAAALDGLGHELLRVALAAVGRLQRDVLEDDVDPGLGAHVGDPRAHHPGAEHDDLVRRERLDRVGTPAGAGGCLHVEEERLDHVLRHLAGDQVDEVAALDLDRVVEVDLRALDRRGHDVVRGWVVRALDLLAQVGRERGQVHRELRVRRGAAGDLVALHVPRLNGLGVRLDPLLGGRDELLAGRRRPRRPSRAPWPWPAAAAGPAAAAFISASTIPSIRTVRTTPPAPGSSPSWTSGKPITAFGSSTITR